MFTWLTHLNIRAKVILLLIIPVVGMIAFAFHEMIDKNQLANELEAIETLSLLGVQMSNLVHETQKERGKTALFLGSQGTQFASELHTQNQATDQKIPTLQTAFQDLDIQQFGETFERPLRLATDALDRLEATRQGVKTLQLPLKDALAYYTQMNAAFLQAITAMAHLSPESEVTTQVTAYVSFLQAKERAGIERAVLSNTFAAGQFAPGLYRKFITLVAEQQTYHQIFKAFATPEQSKRFQEAMQALAVQETQRMRNIAFEGATATEFPVEASVWFAKQTEKINQLKTVEDSLAQDLIALVHGHKQRAESTWSLFAVLTFVSLGIAVVCAVLMTRSISAPMRAIAEMAQVATRIAQGDVTQTLTYSKRDEVGTLAQALNAMTENLREILTSMTTQTTTLRSAADELTTMSQDLTENASTMSNTAETSTSAAQEMSDNMTTVATATEQASDKMTMIATATEQMTATVNEIAQNTEKTRQVTTTAVERVSRAAGRVGELSESGQAINSVTDTILEIAEQTKLLALNATIEAARAGEAGKGFAVVANEVKDLASQTNDATEDIRKKIEGMQRATASTVEDITTVQHIILEVSDLVTSIASAVEEQSVTTRDIAKNTAQGATGLQHTKASVSEASTVSDDIAGELTAVVTSSQEVKTSSSDLQEHATALNTISEQLQVIVQRFTL